MAQHLTGETVRVAALVRGLGPGAALEALRTYSQEIRACSDRKDCCDDLMEMTMLRCYAAGLLAAAAILNQSLTPALLPTEEESLADA